MWNRKARFICRRLMRRDRLLPAKASEKRGRLRTSIVIVVELNVERAAEDEREAGTSSYWFGERARGDDGVSSATCGPSVGIGVGSSEDECACELRAHHLEGYPAADKRGRRRARAMMLELCLRVLCGSALCLGCLFKYSPHREQYLPTSVSRLRGRGRRAAQGTTPVRLLLVTAPTSSSRCSTKSSGRRSSGLPPNDHWLGRRSSWKMVPSAMRPARRST